MHNVGPLDVVAYIVIVLGVVFGTVGIVARVVRAIRSGADPLVDTVILLRPKKAPERAPPKRALDSRQRRARAYFAQRGPPNRKR